MRHALTIRQLAALAGVSQATVSMALHNHPRISPATRERIWKLAKTHGYTPDPVVSSLMNRLRTGRNERPPEKIAYLTFWNTADRWKRNLNERAYFEGACERALETGYEIDHFWAKEPGMNGTRLSRILYTRGIRGIVLGPLPQHLGHVSLDWPLFASAALGLTIAQPPLHRASHAYHEAMILALRTLKRRGYQRIGFANSAIFDQRVQHGWLSGFLTFQHQLPQAQRITPLLVREWGLNKVGRLKFPHSPEIGPDACAGGLVWNPDRFYKWLDEHRPDVVISNTAHPLGFLRERGIRVPGEIAFASLHRLLDSDPWAGIDRQPRQIGAAAVDLVTAQLQNHEYGLPRCPKTVSIEGVWRDGPTVNGRES